MLDNESADTFTSVVFVSFISWLFDCVTEEILTDSESETSTIFFSGKEATVILSPLS